jgi:hypothetical protein
LCVLAQIVGGCLGAIVANIIFDLPAIDRSTKDRSSAALWLSEGAATAGLLLVIHGCVRRVPGARCTESVRLAPEMGRRRRRRGTCCA